MYEGSLRPSIRAIEIILPSQTGAESGRTASRALLPVWRRQRERTPASWLAGKLALYGAGEAQQGEVMEDAWRTAPNHSRPGSCVAEADIDAEDHPERDPQNGH